jgi:hypothetical protein
MTTASTKYGNKKIASKSENEWWKKGEWRTERGSGAEVVIPIVISVVLRVNVLEKQADMKIIMIVGHVRMMQVQAGLEALMFPTTLHGSP